jgi:hypothetical protein
LRSGEFLGYVINTDKRGDPRFVRAGYRSESLVLRIFAYLSKNDDMTTEKFIDYYENHHVPMILSLADPPTVYTRHYLKRNDVLNVGDASIDFDVMTEQAFTDRAAFQAWIAAVAAGGAGERVAADEARFLDRSRTRVCVVNDYRT